MKIRVKNLNVYGEQVFFRTQIAEYREGKIYRIIEAVDTFNKEEALEQYQKMKEKDNQIKEVLLIKEIKGVLKIVKRSQAVPAALNRF